MGGWAPQKRKESQCRPATRRNHSRSLPFYLAGTRFSQPGIGLCAQRSIVGFGRLQSKGRVGHGGACARGIPTIWGRSPKKAEKIETLGLDSKIRFQQISRDTPLKSVQMCCISKKNSPAARRINPHRGFNNFCVAHWWRMCAYWESKFAWGVRSGGKMQSKLFLDQFFTAVPMVQSARFHSTY